MSHSLSAVYEQSVKLHTVTENNELNIPNLNIKEKMWTIN